MAKMLNYYYSDAWKKKRKRILNRDKACILCKGTTNLQVHHLTYKRFGKEKLSDLVVLCKKCHEKTHKDKKLSLLNPVGKAKRKRKGIVKNANEAKVFAWQRRWLGKLGL